PGLSLRKPEDDHRISIRITELEVPAGCDRDVLLTVQRERHRRRLHAGPGLALPEALAGLGVERVEVTVPFAGEREAARCRQRSAHHRLVPPLLPGDLA